MALKSYYAFYDILLKFEEKQFCVNKIILNSSLCFFMFHISKLSVNSLRSTFTITVFLGYPSSMIYIVVVFCIYVVMLKL